MKVPVIPLIASNNFSYLKFWERELLGRLCFVWTQKIKNIMPLSQWENKIWLRKSIYKKQGLKGFSYKKPSIPSLFPLNLLSKQRKRSSLLWISFVGGKCSLTCVKQKDSQKPGPSFMQLRSIWLLITSMNWGTSTETLSLRTFFLTLTDTLKFLTMVFVNS